MLVNAYSTFAVFCFTVNKMTNVKMSVCQIWDLISAGMKERGWLVSGTQCWTKFKTLKKKYKATADANRTSGAGRTTWKYFDVSMTADVSAE